MKIVQAVIDHRLLRIKEDISVLRSEISSIVIRKAKLEGVIIMHETEVTELEAALELLREHAKG